MIIGQDQIVKWSKFQLQIIFSKKVSPYTTQIASVKINGEVVCTVPEGVLNVTQAVFDLNGNFVRDESGNIRTFKPYGLMLDETTYNYLDFESAKLVLKSEERVDESGNTVIVACDRELDVSQYFSEETGEIEVAAGDEISFVGTDGKVLDDRFPKNSALSAITYLVKK